MKCAFCERKLPEPGHTHVIQAEGRVDTFYVCVGCLKRLKLKMTGLRRPEDVREA